MEKRDLAVALQYEGSKSGAPTVIASGRGFLAKKIVTTAQESGVAVMANPRLAEALGEIRIGHEIPEELYSAVAEVLAFVYSLDRNSKNL